MLVYNNSKINSRLSPAPGIQFSVQAGLYFPSDAVANVSNFCIGFFLLHGTQFPAEMIGAVCSESQLTEPPRHSSSV